VFCIQRSDQKVELNESFGFRMKIELSQADILKRNKPYMDMETGEMIAPYKYENTPFYIEANLYSLLCKFGDMGYKQVMKVFNSGKMK
jgi:hypothetical protein